MSFHNNSNYQSQASSDDSYVAAMQDMCIADTLTDSAMYNTACIRNGTQPYSYAEQFLLGLRDDPEYDDPSYTKVAYRGGHKELIMPILEDQIYLPRYEYFVSENQKLYNKAQEFSRALEKLKKGIKYRTCARIYERHSTRFSWDSVPTLVAARDYLDMFTGYVVPDPVSQDGMPLYQLCELEEKRHKQLKDAVLDLKHRVYFLQYH